MTRYLILIFIALSLLSACSEDIQESTTSASTQEKTKNLNAKEIMQNKDVKYSINESGLVIFKNAHDLILIMILLLQLTVHRMIQKMIN